MKTWQAIVLIILGLLIAYLLLRLLVGTAVLLLVGGAVITVIASLVTAWFGQVRAKTLPRKAEQHRFEKQADRALAALKKSDTQKPPR